MVTKVKPATTTTTPCSCYYNVSHILFPLHSAPTLTVSVSPASSTILDTSPYNIVSLQCTVTAEEGVLATKTFQWNRKASGTTTTSVLTSNGSTSISNSNINSPESTSTLTTPEDSAGTYTYTCTGTVLLDGGPDVVSSASVSVVVQGRLII